MEKSFTKLLFRENVVEYLLDCILQKRFVAGEKINEFQISQELDISKGAVREAIRDLVAMGFLDVVPYKGAYLRLLSTKDYHDYYDARALMEEMVIRVLFDSSKGYSLDINELENIVSEIFQDAKNGDMKSLVLHDLEFHKSFFKFMENDPLLKAWEALGNYYWMSLRVFTAEADMFREAEKHLKIIEAIKTKDLNNVLEAMDEHLEGSRTEYVEKLIAAKCLKK